jgi:hypothetical protein
MTPSPEAFELNGVAYLIRPWGAPAGDLEQLRHGIASAPEDVLFCHAVQYQLQHPGVHELPPDDFSRWIGGVLQDGETAERMSFVVQGCGPPFDHLRAALLEVLDAIPEKRRVRRTAPEGSAFPFMGATPVSFPTGTQVHDGQELIDALLAADACVWFLHLVQEPWFTPGRAPLLAWLDARAETRLAGWLAEAAADGLPIDRARSRAGGRWRRSRIGRQVAEATGSPESERREAARQAVAKLVRRRSGTRS